MKKFLLVLLCGIFSTAVYAQLDVQLHYLFVKNEKARLLSTVEYFNADTWGSTYFFIDMQYGVAKNLHGVNLAYWEITRNLKFWKSPFEIHLEYDGGFGEYEATPYIGAFQINNAWLFGGQYTWANSNFSKMFTLQIMYKFIRFANYPSFQITGVWNLLFFNKKLTLSGFFDFWKEKKVFAGGNTGYVFNTQPQFWYNVGKHLSLGTEIEIEDHLVVKEFRIDPTIAAKWTF